MFQSDGREGCLTSSTHESDASIHDKAPVIHGEIQSHFFTEGLILLVRIGIYLAVV